MTMEAIFNYVDNLTEEECLELCQDLRGYGNTGSYPEEGRARAILRDLGYVDDLICLGTLHCRILLRVSEICLEGLKN